MATPIAHSSALLTFAAAVSLAEDLWDIPLERILQIAVPILRAIFKAIV